MFTMRNFSLLCALVFMSSCGKYKSNKDYKELKSRLEAAEARLAVQENKTVEAIEAGKCWVEQVDEVSAKLVCGDGSSFTVKNGQDGQDGVDGQDGQDGEDGQDGQDGIDGVSCSVAQVPNVGAIVTCGETTALITNGQDGVDGQDGQDGVDGKDGISPVIEFINPCTDQRLDEVIMRFADGTLIAHYSSGTKQHLVKLIPGAYRTTDGYACNFRVTNDMQVVW